MTARVRAAAQTAAQTAAWYDSRLNLAAHPLAWPLARLARRVGPLVRVPGFGVVVSDAELAHDVLVRDDDFTKNGPKSLAATMTRFLGPAALGNMDGTAHRRLRSQLADLFAPAQVPTLLQACDAPLAGLRTTLAGGQCVELVRWMRALSGRLTFDLLGVALPAGSEEAACLELLALGERIAASFGFRPPPARRARTLAADCGQLAAYARTGYASPHAPPSSLVRRLRGLGLSYEEARGVISLVFLAGTLTTAAALPRIVALLVDSGQLAPLRHDPAAVTRAIAEGLRFTTPVPATVRIARRDVSLGGHRIAAGTRMVILTCNLARDARLFPDPDRFDAARVHDPRARHLWYGAGPHFCLGFAVAQRQLQGVLEALLAEPGELCIVRRRAARGVLIPSYAQLVVRLGPATRAAA